MRPHSRPVHGLVIGKFYPPHLGHHLLVDAAAACVDRLTVLVMAASVESIPLDRRVAWMQEVHPNARVLGVRDDHPVDLHSDAIWEAHVSIMRDALGEPIDAVFTAEDYGDELARRLGARHGRVDVARELIPTSGTAVRRDPVANWEWLSEPVRGGIARRVVLVGAESTGKTTLTAELCDALRARGGAHGLTRAVYEFGRELTLQKLAVARAQASLAGEPPPGMDALHWPTADFERIAIEQNRREERSARLGGPILLCDTDAFATGVWHERYVGHRSESVDALAQNHDALYLLTDPDDVPFVQDGIRDGQHLRRWMTDTFAARLTARGRRFQVIRGDQNERRTAALHAIDAWIAEGWGFAHPLG